MNGVVPKAVLLLSGTKVGGIDIRSIRSLAEQMRPRYQQEEPVCP